MHNKPLHLLSALWIILLIAQACSPFTKVYSEEEPGVRLSKYHTFNWLSDAQTQKGNAGTAWLTVGAQAQIRSAVEEQMLRYGFKPCDEKPDLMLHYHVVLRNEVLFMHDMACSPLNEGPGQYNRCNRVQAVHYREGTLLIDLIDTKNGNQVWRGAAVSVLDGMKPDEVDARIKTAVKAIFKKFPEKPIR